MELYIKILLSWLVILIFIFGYGFWEIEQKHRNKDRKEYRNIALTSWWLITFVSFIVWL